MFCWQCGHQLLPEGRTLPPATEQQRRDAEAMATLNERKWAVIYLHRPQRWEVDDLDGGPYGQSLHLASEPTLTDAILTAAAKR